MKSAVHAGLALLLVALATSSCTSILGSFDYAAGGSTTTTTTSSSSTGTMMSGSSSGTTTTTTGTGGGTTCTATCMTASSCPAPSGQCSYATCNDGCCGVANFSANTMCTIGGTVCDGSGDCVQCLNTGACPTPSSPTCATPTCKGGMCGDDYAVKGTKCTENGGTECDGNGSCVSCLSAADCQATGTTCATPACTGGACKPTDASAGTKCTNNGTVCDGSGNCVACNQDADCPPSTTVCATPKCNTTAHTCGATYAAKGTACEGTNQVCDGSGNCTSSHCNDGTMDGGETGVDCGGTCPKACPNAQGCAVATDCLSGYCSSSVCAACGKDGDCGSGNYCSSGVCKPTQGQATACTMNDQCTSGSCADGVCCNVQCNGTCQGCTLALTGLATGTCGSYLPGTPAPSGQCTVVGGAPCGNDGNCGATGACEQAAGTVTCGALSCMNGTLTPIGSCSGMGTCKPGVPAACLGNLQCASMTACLTTCTGDSSCVSGYYCAGGTCKAMGGPGGACTMNDQCASGFCADGVCCNSACNTGCSVCNLTGMVGTCEGEPNGSNNPNHPCAGGTGNVCCANSGGMQVCADTETDLNNCGSCGKVCPTSATACVIPTCVGGSCTSVNAGKGQTCTDSGGHVCNGTGTCVQCNSSTDCSSSAPECCNNKCIATVAQVSGNCLLKSDGTVWCWGSNTYGQVGDGTTTTRTTPVQVTALGNGNAQISGNGYTNCARTSGGAVWCWGYNATGQLSNGTTSFTPNGVPVQAGVTTIGNSAAQIAVGSSSTCARKTDGTLWCWGAANSGQLGTGMQSSVPATEPVQAVITNVAQVSVGGSHACARRTDGTLWCWGNNTSGQVGDGTMNQHNSPVQIGTLTIWTDVATGGVNTCGTRSDGSGWCWGDNSSGQIGDGTTTQRLAPAQISGITAVGNVVVGGGGSGYGNHSCARQTTGALSCWGFNGDGDVGDGTALTTRLTPVSVALVGSTVASMSPAGNCAVRTDGSMWCWGSNITQGIPDGTTVTVRPLPERLPMGVCTSDQCDDGTKDGTETDLDCGGSCATTDGLVCQDTKGCSVAADCSYLSVCLSSKCTAGCADGIKDGQESDVDCGGPWCNGCALGKKCGSDNDCGSSDCSGGLCACVGSMQACSGNQECCMANQSCDPTDMICE